MKLAVLCVCVAMVMAIDQVTLSINDRLAPIQETNAGKFIIQMAEMHAQMNGALDELIETINALENDLQDELKNLDADFARRTNSHTKTVNELTLSIGTAEIDIASSQDSIDNYLEPTVEQTEARIQQISENIEENRATLQKETVLRTKEHDSFVSRVQEHQEAIDSIDAALQIIGQLVNQPSLAQGGHLLTNAIQKVESTLQKKTDFAPMIEVLLNLSKNFSNQSDVKEIIGLMNSLRNDVVDQLNTDSKEEAQRQNDWQDRQQALQKEFFEFQRALNENTVQLDATNQRIAGEKDNIQARTSDLAQFNEQLNAENSAFASESNIYQETRTQLLKEIVVAQGAYEFINSADFSGYISSRINVGL